MSILKLKPACKDYLWGGHRLAEEYNVEFDGEILAEAWELSCHPDGPSMIVNGPYAGKSLKEYLDAEGMDVLGTHCRRFREFPILTKFIDAKDNLSIQVHPSNGFALQNEGQYGKTEMWYVLDAEEGAFLYYGFKEEISNGTVTVCPSMPSIEYWFLLHFVDYTKLIKSYGEVADVLAPYLKPCFPNETTPLKKLLKKEKNLVDSTWVENLCADGKLDNAINRAEKNLKAALEAGKLEEQSYSYVFKVFKR